ncbi:hypothetical protein [Paraburkholderia sp. RL17-347-BIC-D]|uniref:hypothetical protein n=1 Tax=Paraburkholderia sp. RL17-347-BIC-D TaxID=3031632 RepID=UPI0038BB7B6F
MAGVTITELKPYRARVAARIKTNANNPTWAILRTRWDALASYCRGCIERRNAGEPYNRWEFRAHQEVVKLAAYVNADELMTMVLSVYLLRVDRPQRFRSDDAFLFQLVRRCMRMTDVNVGVSFNHRIGRSVRVYRECPPRVMGMLGDYLMDVFGTAAALVAELETAHKRQAQADKASLYAALEALQ